MSSLPGNSTDGVWKFQFSSLPRPDSVFPQAVSGPQSYESPSPPQPPPKH